MVEALAQWGGASRGPEGDGSPGILGYRLVSADIGALEVVLAPGGAVRADPGAMICKDGAVEMEITTGGGVWTALWRKLLAQGAFWLPEFRNTGTASGRAVFGAPYPGRPLALELAEHGGEVLAQKGAFLCATADVRPTFAFQKKISAAILGQEGFVLQRFAGARGTVFVHAGGTALHRRLEAGEALDVDLGCVVAFSATVTYDVRSVGTLEKGALGGEGIWLLQMTGPGDVYVQSLPPWRVAAHLRRFDSTAARRRAVPRPGER